MATPLKQDTQEWLDFRKGKIGASDAPVIMGKSSYKTPYELWLEMTGQKSPPPMSTNMSFGKEMEEKIRQEVEEDLGEFFFPKVFVHPIHDWIMASLDGISGDGKTILEIKVTSEEIFNLAVDEGILAEHFRIQGQQQLACCPQAEKVLFVLWNKGRIHKFFLDRDDDHWEDIYEAIHEFYWERVIAQVAPEIGEKDYIVIEEEEALPIADEWKAARREVEEIKAKLKEAEEREKKVRDRLLDFTDDGNCIIWGVKVTRFFSKGSIDYKKIPQLEGVDLELYRKPLISKIIMTQVKT